MLEQRDREYIDLLRGASVIRVVLAHLGLSWFFLPYSSYISILFPILFFVSGVVSYNSFANSSVKRHYIIKRCLGIAIPFFVFMLPLAVIYAPDKFEASFTFIMKWLVLMPNSDLFPFPIGQIWFITCLLLCAIFSFPLFLLQKKLSFTLLTCLVLLIVLPSFVPYQGFLALDFYVPSFLSKYILFEVFALGQFFILGTCYAIYKDKISTQLMLVVGSLIFGVWLSIDIYTRYTGAFAFSEVRPNTYIFQSLGVVLLVLGLQKFITSMIDFIPLMRRFLLFCNVHAYSIFIIHIPILYAIESLFAWQDLSGQTSLALVRMLLVVAFSLVLSIPLSWLHKKLTNKLKSAILSVV